MRVRVQSGVGRPLPGWVALGGLCETGVRCDVPCPGDAGHGQGAERDAEGQGQRTVRHIGGVRPIHPGGPLLRRQRGGGLQEVCGGARSGTTEPTTHA